MIFLKTANLGLRFLLELCALVALGFWGFKTGNGAFSKIILGLSTPLLAAIVWGMFGSPAAPYRLDAAFRLVLEIFINGSAALALYASGKISMAIMFAVVVLVNKILMIAWEQ